LGCWSVKKVAPSRRNKKRKNHLFVDLAAI
jgi:hypothetical protein